MVRVHTTEERLNPKRKRRLRKKLHVAEFKEYFVEFFIPALPIDMTEETDLVIDRFLDFTDDLLYNYNLDPMCMTISGDKGTNCFFTIPIHLYSDELVDVIVEAVREEYGEVKDIEIDDAWYPENEDEDDDT